MEQPDEKYLRNYAYEFKDREVKNPMTYDMVVNSVLDGRQNITLVPTPGQVTEQGTPYSKAVMQQGLQEGILDLIYPVGSIKMFKNDKDWSNYLGFTWQLVLMDSYPIGYNPNSSNVIGDEVGSNMIKLREAQLPKHRFSIPTKGASSDEVWGATDDVSVSKGANVSNGTASTGTIYTSYIGSGENIDIRPKSSVIAFWERVS